MNPPSNMKARQIPINCVGVTLYTSRTLSGIDDIYIFFFVVHLTLSCLYLNSCASNCEVKPSHFRLQARNISTQNKIRRNKSKSVCDSGYSSVYFVFFLLKSFIIYLIISQINRREIILLAKIQKTIDINRNKKKISIRYFVVALPSWVRHPHSCYSACVTFLLIT